MEVQVASDDRIFDKKTAAALGIFGNDQIVIMVHCGSRGIWPSSGGTDYLKVFEKAMRRGIHQLGTLGSGNHYLEVQVASDDGFLIRKPRQPWVFSETIKLSSWSIADHAHQVATDYLKVFEKAMRRHGISVPDQQLACAINTSLP